MFTNYTWNSSVSISAVLAPLPHPGISQAFFTVFVRTGRVLATSWSFDGLMIFTQQLTIIGRGWAIWDLSVASGSIICRGWRLRQIIDLWDTDKSRYFATTEFNNWVFRDYFWEITLWQLREAICHFHARAWFQLRMSRILFAAKHSWTVLRMGRPLFVGSYLQVTCFALNQWKEGKNTWNDNNCYFVSMITSPANIINSWWDGISTNWMIAATTPTNGTFTRRSLA